jgi:DNA-binding MarR family transcriptional regulator
MSSAAKAPGFTETQGQYLAFIHTYVLLNRQAPAEADFQRFFCVTPPSVHSMIKQLERLGFIRRTPRQARSIELLVPADQLPALQPIKTSVARY